MYLCFGEYYFGQCEFKIILKMCFQRVDSCDCPVQQQEAAEGWTRPVPAVMPLSPPGTLPRAGTSHHQHTPPSTHRGKGHHPSVQICTWGKHPIPGKSSFGSLIKKQGSQHQGIDFHQLISITSFHHQLPYSTKLLETIFIDCSSSRQKRPWLIICYPQTPCAFQIITWCSTEEMNWMCSQ